MDPKFSKQSISSYQSEKASEESESIIAKRNREYYEPISIKSNHSESQDGNKMTFGKKLFSFGSFKQKVNNK